MIMYLCKRYFAYISGLRDDSFDSFLPSPMLKVALKQVYSPSIWEILSSISKLECLNYLMNIKIITGCCEE